MEFTPHTAHAAAAASVPVHESYDAVRSQRGRCESAPDNRATGDTNQSSRGRSCAANFGVAASEKRDPKRTNKWQSHDDCCPSNSMYIIIVWDYNKLLLQQLAVTAGCCCSMLLYCGDESASPNECGTVYAHMVLYPPSSSSAAWKDFDDVAQHTTCSNESTRLEYCTIPSIALDMVIHSFIHYKLP